jgi:hypothetical protein
VSHVGYYINLDRSPDRRAAMEARLRLLDPPAPYQRFAGIDGNAFQYPNPELLTDTQIGCFTSHHQVLLSHADRSEPLHILEDDAVLAHRAVSFVDQIIESGMLDDVDVLFTSTVLPDDFFSFREARTTWRSSVERAADGTATSVRFIAFPYFASTASYLVNPRSVGPLCARLGEELAGGAHQPIDIFIREEAEQGRLRVQCLFPFISSVMPAAFVSTIDFDEDKRRWTVLMDLLRHSFFVECDQRATLDLANRALASAKADPQEQLHARIAAYLSSDQHRRF